MDIIAMARELGKAIQQDERYKRIDAAKTANDKDEELQQLIQKFNMKRSELSVEMAQENKNPESSTSSTVSSKRFTRKSCRTRTWPNLMPPR